MFSLQRLMYSFCIMHNSTTFLLKTNIMMPRIIHGKG
jgi:hypothetical protein